MTISSVFSSLLEPAYKATVTDLLTEEQYTKASGLVQVAGSAKYLISPVLAGYLLSVSDIKLLLIIDICTIFVTATSTLAVRRGLASKKYEQAKSVDYENFLGFIQTLSIPMILAFSDSSALGTVETIVASGMLVTSVFIGILSIKKGYVKMLSVSLFCAGLFMAVFGMHENIVLIYVSGFLFFAMLPFANTSLDLLIHTNIENSVQGRAWGFIGVISQLGYVVAYALSGMLADYIFTPLLLNDGVFADSIGRIFGTGSGRGSGFLIFITGVLVCVTSIILYSVKSD